MTKVLLVKSIDGAFRPADQAAWEFTTKIPVGIPCPADLRNPERRSNRQHSFWFAMIGQIYENQDKYQSFERFRKRLLAHLGHCDLEKLPDGRVLVHVHSVAFGKMSADEFGALVDETLDFAETQGFNRAELLEKTRDMVPMP